MIKDFTLKRKSMGIKIVSFLTLIFSLAALQSMGQEVWEFSNAGATGRSGPTQAEVNSVYLGTNLEGDVSINTQGIQEWVVPVDGLYRIDALGAQGGTIDASNPGGLGAEITGEFILSEGEVIHIAVGQRGLSSGMAAGGGGASFVYNSTTTELLVAAGGGGGTTYTGNGSPNALAGNSGDVAGLAGTGNSAGGGGSFSNDGGTAQGQGGLGFLNGAEGGCGHFFGSCDENQGGFGGGGGGSWANGNDGAGGGGGYTGGNGGAGGQDTHGDGGGSFNTGSAQINVGGSNQGQGGVALTRLYFVSLINSVDATCFGSTDGSLTAQATGGITPYTFTWSNSVTTISSDESELSVNENLSPGEYTVTVTDAIGMETSGTYSIGPDPIEVSFDMTQTSTCDEVGDGGATANVTGGTAPYTYSWDSGEDTQSISNKSFGSYEITVTDNNGCDPAVASVAITADDNTAPVALVEDIEVFLDANGTASIVADDIDNGSTDDCAIASMSIDVSEFSCADVGATPSFDGNTVLAFDGEDDYLEFDQVIPYSANHTFAFWIKTEPGSGGTAFTWGSPTVNNSTGLRIWSNRIRYSSVDGPGQTQSVNTSSFLGDNEWHHVVAVRNGNDVQIFVDGQLDVSGQITNQISNPTSTTLGGGLINGIYQSFMNGQLNDFAYWPSALSAQVIESMACTGPQGAEIFLDFETGAGTTTVADQSGNGNAGSLVNMDANADWVSFGDAKELEYCPAGVKTTLSITDAGGNVSEADAYVTVLDTISPTAISKSFTVELGANGTGALSAEDVDNGSTDNCEVDEMSVNKNSFNCIDLGTNQVIMSVADIHGNSKSTSAEVEVVDLLDPTLSVQNVQVSLDDEGNASITTSDAEVSSADNCGIASKSLSLTEFSCEDLGQVIEVDMTVTDGSGNTHTETFEVTVIEENDPVADPQAYTVGLDENGLVEFNQTMIDDFIGGDDADDCSGIDADSRSINQTQFSCEDLGENTVTYSVSDLSGNTGTAPVVITIVDELAPIALAQDIVAELDEDGLAVISADDADNGSVDNCSVATRELNITEFSCENLGEQEVTMTVTDGSGNESQATFTVTVVDQVAPAIAEGLSATVYLDENGEGLFDSTPLMAEATDNCGVDAILSGIGEGEYADINGFPFSCEEVGTSSGPLFVRDNSGNLTEFMLELNVVDTIKPTFDLNAIELQVNAEGVATLSEEMLTQYAADNCGIAEVNIEIEQFDCSQIGAMQFTQILVYDLHGNSVQQTLEVQLIDNMAPQVQVEDITIELDANGSASLNADALDMMIQDNCTPEEFQLSQEVFSCENLGSNSLMVTVMDASGNSGSAEFNVTVVDNVAPQIQAPQLISLCAGSQPDYSQISATDNCSVELVILEGIVPVDVNTLGEYMIQAQATDPSGNIATQAITVVIEPLAAVDLGEDMEVDEGAQITLIAGENNANTYLWSDGSTGNIYQFVATEDVTVTVEVTTPYGCSVTDEINISIGSFLGVDEDENGNSVRFFPNPTSGNLSLELGLNKAVTNLQITIMDISGKAIDQKMIPAAQNRQVINLDLSHAAKGIYLVNVKADELNLTERIVKQ